MKTHLAIASIAAALYLSAAYTRPHEPAESLFLGLVRETEASLATGYDIPLEYTRAFTPEEYTALATAAFLKLVFNR